MAVQPPAGVEIGAVVLLLVELASMADNSNGDIRPNELIFSMEARLNLSLDAIEPFLEPMGFDPGRSAALQALSRELIAPHERTFLEFQADGLRAFVKEALERIRTIFGTKFLNVFRLWFDENLYPIPEYMTWPACYGDLLCSWATAKRLGRPYPILFGTTAEEVYSVYREMASLEDVAGHIKVGRVEPQTPWDAYAVSLIRRREADLLAQHERHEDDRPADIPFDLVLDATEIMRLRLFWDRMLQLASKDDLRSIHRMAELRSGKSLPEPGSLRGKLGWPRP